MKALNRQQASGRVRARGFTLIELMVAVAIVAVLTGIAVPLYNEQARKARRATGKADMMELVQALERYNTVNGTFAGFPAAAVTSPRDGDPSYSIVPSNLTVNTYTLTATAEGPQTDDRCGTLTINQAGIRTEGGADTEVADCW